MATETTRGYGGEISPWTRRYVSAREWVLSHIFTVTAVLLLIFLWIPLAVMMILSVAVNSSTFFPFRGFTLDHYAATFADAGLMASLMNSVEIATLAAIVATVFGVLASFALARYNFPYKEIYRTVGILPMVVPGVVLGIALL
ncbi:MAG: ABC transporter permease, partial [Halanaeroarchaeum sp.]